MNFILWRYKGKVTRGAANKRTHIKMLCADRGLSYNSKDIDESICSLKIEMGNRQLCRSISYQ